MLPRQQQPRFLNRGIPRHTDSAATFPGRCNNPLGPISNRLRNAACGAFHQLNPQRAADPIPSSNGPFYRREEYDRENSELIGFFWSPQPASSSGLAAEVVRQVRPPPQAYAVTDTVPGLPDQQLESIIQGVTSQLDPALHREMSEMERRSAPVTQTYASQLSAAFDARFGTREVVEEVGEQVDAIRGQVETLGAVQRVTTAQLEHKRPCAPSTPARSAKDEKPGLAMDDVRPPSTRVAAPPSPPGDEPPSTDEDRGRNRRDRSRSRDRRRRRRRYSRHRRRPVNSSDESPYEETEDSRRWRRREFLEEQERREQICNLPPPAAEVGVLKAQEEAASFSADKVTQLVPSDVRFARLVPYKTYRLRDKRAVMGPRLASKMY